MDVQAFRKAREKFDNEIPYYYPEKGRKRRNEIEDAASPEHVPTPHSKGHSDWYTCSCGWESDSFWDGITFAWKQWREHVADVMGLIPKQCPCGKQFVPADGEKPCHELREVD